MVWGGSFLIAAAALKTPTINGYNAQGVNLTFSVFFSSQAQNNVADLMKEMGEEDRSVSP